MSPRPSSAERPSLATSVALLIALFAPPLFVVIPTRVFGESPDRHIQLVLQLLYCGLAGFIAWIVLRVERLPLSSIGLRRPDWSTVVLAALVWFAALYLLPLVTTSAENALGVRASPTTLQTLAALPLWFRVFIAVTGGIVEEMLYRGYAIERLATITGRRWLGATISAAVFGLAHVPAWGLGFALVIDLPFGIVMTLFYLWRRDLLANILAHSTGLVLMLGAM